MMTKFPPTISLLPYFGQSLYAMPGNFAPRSSTVIFKVHSQSKFIHNPRSLNVIFKGRFDNCGGRNRFLTIYFPDVNTLPNQCVLFFMRFLSLFVSLKFIFYFGINFLILFMFLLCSYISHEEL